MCYTGICGLLRDKLKLGGKSACRNAFPICSKSLVEKDDYFVLANSTIDCNLIKYSFVLFEMLCFCEKYLKLVAHLMYLFYLFLIAVR